MESNQSQELWQKACAVRQKAYAPYSHYQVGAAVLVEGSAEIFSGCNVENASYGGTICAERSAILQAVAHTEGTPRLLEVLVVTREPAPPCGLCLQVITEFGTPETRITLASPEGISSTHSLQDFFPHPFSPTSLDPS